MADTYSVRVLTGGKEILVGDMEEDKMVPGSFLHSFFPLRLGAIVTADGWSARPAKPLVFIPLDDIKAIIKEAVEWGHPLQGWFDSERWPKL